MNRKNVLTFVLNALVLSLFSLNAQHISISNIPYSLSFENEAIELKQVDTNAFTMLASAKTDLFVSPDGGYRVNNSPRLLFQPDSNFIFTTRITSELEKNWDAGLLLLYADSTSFAKFCFEKDYQGQNRVVSVVCNETGDDCNSIPINDSSFYFRIIGSSQGHTFGFFYSNNAVDWLLIRSFKLSRIDNLRIGFGVQSPNGVGCSARFSEIELLEQKPVSWWEGI